jgi:hypothetical protein
MKFTSKAADGISSTQYPKFDFQPYRAGFAGLHKGNRQPAVVRIGRSDHIGRAGMAECPGK